MIRGSRSGKTTEHHEVDINPIANKWKKSGLTLMPHQVEGVTTMDRWYREGHSGINADEMGLGKTCQAILMLLRLAKEGKGPFLVVAPLSVCGHWVEEVKRFSCGTLSPVCFSGVVDQRREAIIKMGTMKTNTVFITAYHVFRKDYKYVLKLAQAAEKSFSAVVCDEAQYIKNRNTNITNCFQSLRNSAWFLLMTGTPIQNDLYELYSLLSFADPKFFLDTPQSTFEFVEKYKAKGNLDALKALLSKYMIRRLKNVVCKDLPACESVFIYHDLTDYQKKLYKDIISRNIAAFRSRFSDTEFDGGVRKVTTNMAQCVIPLLKVVAHPYLLKGAEPEPFVEGEHLVTASGKLQVLDHLLKYLRKKGHRCLIFSRFLGVLDVLEDYMQLRDYNFVRIDGSITGENRDANVNQFQAGKTKKNKIADGDPWCFLLTVRSGGIGLNLTAADTVIFLDADYNPQVDIQAMARCHRIGQDKPVRIIRLVGRYTIDQQIQAYARRKAKFTDEVLEEETDEPTGILLHNMVTANLAELHHRVYKPFTLSDEQMEDLIGGTDKDGLWLPLPPVKDEYLEMIRNVDQVDSGDINIDDCHYYLGETFDNIRENDFFGSVVKQSIKDGETRKRANVTRFIDYEQMEEKTWMLTKRPQKKGSKRPEGQVVLKTINDPLDSDTDGDYEDDKDIHIKKKKKTKKQAISKSEKSVNMRLNMMSDAGDVASVSVTTSSAKKKIKEEIKQEADDHVA